MGSSVNAVMGASLGVQIGIVLGLVAVITASVTPAVIVSNKNKGSQIGPEMVPEIPTISPTGQNFFMLEKCETDPAISSDMVIIHLEGLKQPFNDSEKQLVEAGFVDVYNVVAGGCDDIFHQFMQYSLLLKQTMISLENETYLDTFWKAEVRCEGCDPSDPLFGRNEGNFGRLLQPGGSLFDRFIGGFEKFMQQFPDFLYIHFTSMDGKEHVIE